MIKNVLTHIHGIEWYGILSIGLFFASFLGLVIWTLRLGKPYVNSMRQLPLEPDHAPNAPAPTDPNPALRHE
jgi:hypothetical protein